MVTGFVTASGAAEKPQYGGTYRYITGPPRSLDPHQETYGATTVVTCNTNNGLLRTAQNRRDIVPDLARSWRQTDDLTYEFNLHRGVRFHDMPPVNGRELTSADVKYSIERVAGMHGKKPKFKHRYYFEGKVSSIETPDKYTVIIKTKFPYAPFIKYIASPWTSIVAKEAVEEWGDLKKNAVGTGPFILTEYIKGSHIKMVKNPNYFKKGLPYLDGIHLRTMRNAEGAGMPLYLADKMDSTPAYYFQLPTIKKQAPDSKITMTPSLNTAILRMQAWIEGKKPLQPPWDNKKVRQAVAMSIDKQKMINLARGGHADPQIGPIALKPWRLPESDQIEYNPEKAKKMLAEAGYPNGFSAELISWNTTTMAKFCQIIQDMLKDVNINITLNLMATAQYFNRAYRFQYELAGHALTAGDDPEEWLVPYFGNIKTSTYYKWSNKEIWRMIDEQARIMDKKKRLAFIHDIQRKIIDDSPNVFIYTVKSYVVDRPWAHRDHHMHAFMPFMGEQSWLGKR
jgi:peptide/nickel transport system substrate-binding protein